MINIKTPDEIQIMQKGGHMLAETLFAVLKEVKPGVSELEIDKMAEEKIRSLGGEPGFKKVPGYHHTICISTNDVVVHGIPTGYRFQAGDVVGIDCGVYYKGFHTDMAQTLRVGGQRAKGKGQKEDKVDKFLRIGEVALERAIEQAILGNRVGNISQTIEQIVEGAGYGIVPNLIGHGVGRDLHEDPEVPGLLHSSLKRTPLLKEGMTIAIEVIYNMGSGEVVLDRDGWTIRSEDGGMSGLFERSLAITKNGPMILTG